MKVNPIYKKEVKVSSRSMRLSMILWCSTAFWLPPPCLTCIRCCTGCGQLRKFSIPVFWRCMCLWQRSNLPCSLFIMPAVAVGSISGEREKQTFNILLSTQTTPGQIIRER